MDKQGSSQKGSIFYDGLCVVCSREIDHYRNQKGASRFVFIDITSRDFDASKHGVDPYAVHKVMHVKDPSGNLKKGPDAFRAIWKELPKYHFLYRWTDNQIAQTLMSIAYKGFSIIRPYLPRKKATCEASPYCDLKT